ncbi:heme exporter protein CcmD [Balneatrix alpica]|uniref:Heme exporter protein D n=1 Tax=Balneatrix alpica TaxID=75684 RepID=A0ABV5ZHE3_9GAMM|nr:heme exporter protein CcmD [Balneatrix alpica]
MYFSDFAAFLHMDGHGLYVWISYLVAFLVLLLNVWLPLRAGKHYQQQQRKRLERFGSDVEGPL